MNILKVSSTSNKSHIFLKDFQGTTHSWKMLEVASGAFLMLFFQFFLMLVSNFSNVFQRMFLPRTFTRLTAAETGHLQVVKTLLEARADKVRQGVGSGWCNNVRWLSWFLSPITIWLIDVYWWYTLWLFNIAVENRPFIDGLPVFTY